MRFSEMGLWWNLAAMLVVGFLVGDGYGFLEEDLVVKLPGQPLVKFRQYAGYVDVDVKKGRSLFYYFVEAAHDPDHKPFTLLLNGERFDYSWHDVEYHDETLENLKTAIGGR